MGTVKVLQSGVLGIRFTSLPSKFIKKLIKIMKRLILIILDLGEEKLYILDTDYE